MTYNTRTLGKAYEDLAADYLRKKGYTILEQNYCIASGEIDLIAKERDYLVFVEVKYRTNNRHGAPEEAVTVSKQKQISKVALYYMKSHGYRVDTVPVRFDVVAIKKEAIHHIENAFSYQGRC